MSFNSLILIWFDAGNRNLPWRGQTDPYKTWISEIILQQTRVAQGSDYYIRFCNAFPTVKSLAEADEQQVLKLWQGLGYYSRARNLHHSARFIMNEMKGVFPNNFKDLLQLKGVGPYTAAAIASIAFNEVVPAIDGNAFRVLARYFDIEHDISASNTFRYFFELGHQIIDSKRPGDFNQAVMELGATVCLPVNPKCEICPLNESCAALSLNKIHCLPVKTKKTKVKTRRLNFFVITDGLNYLMVKRTADDIWKNLYSFPLTEDKIKSIETTVFGESGIEFSEVHHVTHLLTHRKLEIKFLRGVCTTSQLKQISEKLKAVIYSREDLFVLPVPKPIEKYLKDKI